MLAVRSYTIRAIDHELTYAYAFLQIQKNFVDLCFPSRCCYLGTLDIQALPDPSCPTWTFLEAVLDEEEGTNQVLQVGAKAAECWGRRLGDEILITDTIGWKSYASLIGTIASVNVEAGTVTLSSPPTTHTDSNEFEDANGQEPAGWISTLANDPDFPAEVAWLSRSVTFDADTTQGLAGGGTWWKCNSEQRRIGGHMMISHTSVAQKIEGVEFKNFGQSGTLGRYVSATFVWLCCNVMAVLFPNSLFVPINITSPFTFTFVTMSRVPLFARILCDLPTNVVL